MEKMSAPDPHFPFYDALPPGRYGARAENLVLIATRRHALLQLNARLGQQEKLYAAIQNAFGIALPPPGRSATSGTITALWLQPDGWLLQAPEGAEAELARTLAAGGVAAVVDQTHGRAILSLAGARARDVLARICRLDLHPRVFGSGHVAGTIMADMPVVLHQRDDSPSFDLIIPSSFAMAFATALRHAADPVGYEIRGAL
jgi:heterotetrameric sarcosine oxidase gamma subunit